MTQLKEKIDRLPPQLQREVNDFIDFLANKYKKKRYKTLSQNWAGVLKEYKDKYTSIELQEKVNEWRIK